MYLTRLARFLAACAATAAVLAGAYAIWWWGLAQFDDDYCITSIEIPAGGTGIRGPEWELPMTYRCDFGAAGEVTVNEPRPILFTGVAGGVTLLAVSAIWWWIAIHPARRTRRRARRRSAGAEHEGKHRT